MLLKHFQIIPVRCAMGNESSESFGWRRMLFTFLGLSARKLTESPKSWLCCSLKLNLTPWKMWRQSCARPLLQVSGLGHHEADHLGCHLVSQKELCCPMLSTARSEHPTKQKQYHRVQHSTSLKFNRLLLTHQAHPSNWTLEGCLFRSQYQF